MEKCHLKYLRFSLGVSKKAPKLAVYGETGRYPLLLEAILNSIKYLQRLTNLSENSNALLRKAFEECKKLKSTKSWYSNLYELLHLAGIPINELGIQNTRGIILEIKRFIQNNFFRSWRDELFCDSRSGEHGNKLRTFRTFKNTFAKEEYLNVCHNKVHRQRLSALRLSCHKLQIEKDRYVSKNRLPPELRLCKLCDRGECEYEFHFVMKCPEYDPLRYNMFCKIRGIYPYFQTLNDDNKFIWLMVNLDDRIIKLFAAFVSNCFSRRIATIYTKGNGLTVVP